MDKGSYIVGFVSGLFLAVLVTVMGAIIWHQHQPIHSNGGGGKHLSSPNGKYEAEAWNMQQRSFSGQERNFYSLRVKDNDTGFEVCRYEIPMPKDPVFFREGTGMIEWEKDSSAVRFGTPDQIIWSFSFPTSK